jgi:hypothetical protein
MTEYTMWTGEDIIPIWIPFVLLVIGCLYLVVTVIIMKTSYYNFTNGFLILQSIILSFGLIVTSIILGNKTHKEGTTKHFCHYEIKTDEPIYRTYNTTKYLYSLDHKKCLRTNEYIAIEGKWRHVIVGLTAYEEELKKNRKQNKDN